MPLAAENYSVSKKNTKSDVVIEKRWVTRTETIRIPVRYEELYVNGKPVKPSKADALVSAVRSKIQPKSASTAKKDPVALFDGKGEMEKVIPLYGEQVTVTKKMTHVYDMAIRKQKVTELKRLRVSTLSETAKAVYPSGRVEKLA
jgi:stress response protein YsnF